MSGSPPWWGGHLAETRWTLEAARLLVDPVLRGTEVPRGDGRVVALMPGFLGGDQTLAVLALWLRRLGYAPRTGRFVLNFDCSDRAVQTLEDRVDRWATESRRRVALIGHSRGGHFTRALAARRPDLVSHAITLGADLRSLYEANAPTRASLAVTARALQAAGRTEHAQCLTMDCPCAFTADYRRRFPSDRVRLTSIYSKGDGVVRWQQQVVPEADCVEVSGSHVGLVFNRKVYGAIAEALARPELAGPASSAYSSVEPTS